MSISGILKGLELLKSTGGTPGGTLIVVSDGKETKPPYLRDIWNQVNWNSEHDNCSLIQNYYVNISLCWNI